MNDITNILLTPAGVIVALILLLIALRLLFPEAIKDLVHRITSVKFPGGQLKAAPPQRARPSQPISSNPSSLSDAGEQKTITSPVTPQPLALYSQDDEIRAIKQRRLHELRKKQALTGRSTPPEDLIEIEQLETELRDTARGGR